MATKPAPPLKPGAAKPKPAPRAKPVTAVKPAATKPPKAEHTLRLKDLVDAVSAATGTKPKTARAVIEATLVALGDALAKGSDLNLPALGKAHVTRQRDLALGEVLVIKLRRVPAKAKAAKELLAPPED
jgi:nucleoid DNA-binding protein